MRCAEAEPHATNKIHFFQGLKTLRFINRLDNMISSLKLTCLLSLLFLPIFVSAEYNYQSNAKNAFQVLQKWYNPTSGLWDTAGWWNGANCMTTVAGLAASNPSLLSKATDVFARTYKKAPLENPGFVDSCYDDNGWWALAWIAAYDVTNVTKYLTLAEEIFTNMTGGGPSSCNDGGIYWCSTGNYVNAIANELYLSVAAHLANRPTSNRAYYLSTALSQWIWFNYSGMINMENLINDGLTENCTNNGYPVWTYNQGVILGGLVELDKAAPNASYLATAHAIAAAAIANLTDGKMVLHETACEPNCDGNQTQFKGIFVRNLLKLLQADPKDLYKKFIRVNAKSIWANNRNQTTGQLGLDWAGPIVDPPNASTHSSALDALAAAAVV